MTARATLALVGGSTFQFVTAKTDGGRIPDYPMVILDELTADGVDYARHLLNRRQFKPFTIRTMAEAASYDDAVKTARLYELAKGYTGTLKTTIRGKDYLFKVYVIDVPPDAPMVMAGTPVGSDVSAAAGAGITCKFVLELLEIPATL